MTRLSRHRHTHSSKSKPHRRAENLRCDDVRYLRNASSGQRFWYGDRDVQPFRHVRVELHRCAGWCRHPEDSKAAARQRLEPSHWSVRSCSAARTASCRTLVTASAALQATQEPWTPGLLKFTRPECCGTHGGPESDVVVQEVGSIDRLWSGKSKQFDAR